MIPYEALLFDMDGVVADTEQSVTAFWTSIAAQHDVTLSEDNFRTHIYGRPADRTLDALFPHLGEKERQAVHVAMRRAELQDTYREVPGAVRLLQALRAGGVRTALVTSGEPYKVDTIVRQLNLTDLFSVWVTARDIRVGKPDPQCYLLGAELLAVRPEACVVFEDAVSGVQAAVAAGTRCIGVARQGRERPLLDAGASDTIPDFLSARLVPGDGSESNTVDLDLGHGVVIRLHTSPAQ